MGLQSLQEKKQREARVLKSRWGSKYIFHLLLSYLSSDNASHTYPSPTESSGKEIKLPTLRSIAPESPVEEVSPLLKDRNENHGERDIKYNTNLQRFN